MRFDTAVGNPPYDLAEGSGEYFRNTFHIWPALLDNISDATEITYAIVPPRFLFGKTRKSCADLLDLRHVNYLRFVGEAFRGADIRVAVISYGRSLPYAPKPLSIIPEYEDTVRKVIQADGFVPMQGMYHTEDHLSREGIASDFPCITETRLTSNTFLKFPEIFRTEQEPGDAPVFGRTSKEGRCRRYIRPGYLRQRPILHAYKLAFPRVSHLRSAEDILRNPVILMPGEAFTQTYGAIGPFPTEKEAEATLRYVSTPFAKALLMAATLDQHSCSESLKYLPVQDFTCHSDIDWTSPPEDLNRSLCKKYSLDSIPIQT